MVLLLFFLNAQNNWDTLIKYNQEKCTAITPEYTRAGYAIAHLKYCSPWKSYYLIELLKKQSDPFRIGALASFICLHYPDVRHSVFKIIMNFVSIEKDVKLSVQLTNAIVWYCNDIDEFNGKIIEYFKMLLSTETKTENIRFLIGYVGLNYLQHLPELIAHVGHLLRNLKDTSRIIELSEIIFNHGNVASQHAVLEYLCCLLYEQKNLRDVLDLGCVIFSCPILALKEHRVCSPHISVVNVLEHFLHHNEDDYILNLVQDYKSLLNIEKYISLRKSMLAFLKLLKTLLDKPVAD